MITSKLKVSHVTLWTCVHQCMSLYVQQKQMFGMLSGVACLSGSFKVAVSWLTDDLICQAYLCFEIN